MQKLKVCIDARVIYGDSGGIQQFIEGLASGLVQLENCKEEYYFLCFNDSLGWLEPYLNEQIKIIHFPRPFLQSLIKTLIVKMLCNSRIFNLFSPLFRFQKALIPISDGKLERLGIQAMHFTTQNCFLTQIPSIYHPHDLLHLHYPQFFPRWVALKREIVYRKLCSQAKIVSVASQWVKDDIKIRYHIPDEKIAIVPLAPLTEAYPKPAAQDLSAVKRKFALPEKFIFYPAQTWPHKNHFALLKALSILRDKKGLTINFVSSGKKNSFFKNIIDKVQELHLNRQVQFLDFVTTMELSSLYNLCRCVVIPTRFEAASFPLWEAFQCGAPAACSNVTSLPSQAGNAALLFDPTNVEEMALAISRLWLDDKLCSELVNKGYQRVQNYNWADTAKHFRALYRKVSNQQLTEEDRNILLSRTF